MSELTDFNGTYTAHYELAKPSGEDKVDISVFNQNANKIDSILWGIQQRFDPTPELLEGLVRTDGVAVITTEDIEVARNYDSNKILVIGDSYTITFNDGNGNQTVETVVVQDFSELVVAGSYGFMIDGGIFGVVFNAEAVPYEDAAIFNYKENSIFTSGGGDWIDFTVTPANTTAE